MTKFWKLATATALLVGVAIMVVALPAHADSGSAKAKELSGLVKQAKVKFVDAIATAEKHAKGTAVGGKLEMDDNTLMFEIVVLVPGDAPKLAEVEIDAKTGKVIEKKADEDEDEGCDEGCDEDEDEGCDEGCDEG